MTDVATHEPGVLGDSGLRRVVVVLCVTEIVSWGVLYYAFLVLSPAITEETGWSRLFTMGCFSAGLVTTGVAGIWVGRWIDAWGPRPVMTAGSVLAVPALLLISLAPSRGVFLAGWLVAGIAMAAVLYTPAFTAITQWGGVRALKGLTAVTLVAGLASTVFAPLTAVLEVQLGWRPAYVVLAVLLALVTIPAHAFGLPSEWSPPRRADPAAGESTATPASSRAFVALSVMFAVAAFAAYASVVSLVDLLVSRGVSVTSAALVLGLGGAGQVAGRLFYRRLAMVTSVRTRSVLTLLVLAASTAGLAVVQEPLAALIALSVLSGVSRGIMTLLQATAVPDRWGRVGLGRLNGILAAPAMAASAVAPFAAALLAEPLGGLAPVYLVFTGLLILAAALVPATIPRR